MPWFIYAIAGPFLWAVVNQIDKFLVERFYSKTTENSSKTSGPGSLVLFSSTFGLFVAIGIFLFRHNVFSISFSAILFLIIAGFLTAGWIICYLYALQEDEVSTVAPLFLIEVAFAYLLGLFIFSEQLAAAQIFAILAVLSGGFILSFGENVSKRNQIIKKRVLFLMLLAGILEVLSSILFKYAAIENDFWLAQFWQYLGLGIAGIILFISVKTYRRDFLEKIKKSGFFIFSLNIGSEMLTVVGNLAINVALLLAPVALVYTFISFQALYVFILSLLFTYLGIKGLSVTLERRVLLRKFFSILVMVIGSIFLF